MRYRFLGISLAVLAFFSGPALPEERYALVIGNGAYENIDPLRNPPNDVRLVSQALTGTGFKVTTLIDADLESMDEAVNQFAVDLDNAGENTVGIFYYAGHAVGYQGENWLIPVGADIRQATHLKYRTLSANVVLGLMEEARNATDIVIFDSCRNNPFRGFSLSGTRSLGQGLNTMDIAPSGSYMTFSTAPGQVAYDGSGDYSPFAEAFAEEVSTSDESIGDMMIDVRVRVKEATESLGYEPQIPWTRSSLLGKFWFNPRTTSDERPQQALVEERQETIVAKATPAPITTAPREQPQQRASVVNCSAGPHEFALDAAGYNGQECQFSTRLSGLDKCSLARVEVVVGGSQPQHITLSRSRSPSDAINPQRTANRSGEGQWSTVNHALNCNTPAGCGNGEYEALLGEISADRCDAYENVRLVLTTR